MDYLIELMSAALHGRKATRKPGGVRWEDVYRAAARHAVQPLVFAALPADSFAVRCNRCYARRIGRAVAARC